MAKLMTVIILSYNSMDCIVDAIESVLEQDYEAIELIITDDGSADFDKDKIESYIQYKSGSNLVRYVILDNKENVGTVRNLRRAYEVYTGSYHMILGADDILNGRDVLSSFAQVYKTYQDEPLVVCGNAYQCDSNGKQLYVMIDDSAIDVLTEGDPEKLCNRLRYQCMLITVATCYRREFLDVVGYPDLDCTYLEDWPTFIKMARLGIVPVWLPKVVTKHLVGGIANGEKRVNPEHVKRLFEDRQVMFRKETVPYLDSMPEEAVEGYRKRQEREKKNLYNKTVWPYLSKKQKLLEIFGGSTGRQNVRELLHDKLKGILDKTGEKNSFFLKAFAASLMLFIGFNYISPFDGTVNMYAAGACAVLTVICAVILAVTNIAKALRLIIR